MVCARSASVINAAFVSAPRLKGKMRLTTVGMLHYDCVSEQDWELNSLMQRARVRWACSCLVLRVRSCSCVPAHIKACLRVLKHKPSAAARFARRGKKERVLVFHCKTYNVLETRLPAFLKYFEFLTIVSGFDIILITVCCAASYDLVGFFCSKTWG